MEDEVYNCVIQDLLKQPFLIEILLLERKSLKQADLSHKNSETIKK